MVPLLLALLFTLLLPLVHGGKGEYRHILCRIVLALAAAAAAVTSTEKETPKRAAAQLQGEWRLTGGGLCKAIYYKYYI